jgi:MFS family permease
MANFSSIGAVRVFRNRAYRIYTEGNFVSLVGTWVQRVATGWLAWDLTHSGAWLGAIAAAELLPSIILGPLGGAAADRMDRFQLIMGAQILLALQSLILGWLILAGLVDVWVLFGLTVVHGIITSFNQPARLSMVRNLVRVEDLPAAIAINSVLWNAARFVGPAVAGVLIVYMDVGWAFLVNGLTFVAFIIAMTQLRADIPRASASAGGPVLTQIWEGMTYVRRHEGLGPLICLLLIGSVFVRPFAELLPGFADAVFGRGADGLAMLTSATGVGAVIAGAWLSQVARVRGQTSLALHSLFAMALAMFLLCATDYFWLGLVATSAAGCFMVVNGVAAQSLVQYATAPEMLGRVLSLYGLSARAGPAIGALLMGAASEFFGLRVPVAIGAVVCIVAYIWALKRQRTIAKALSEGASSGSNH